LGALVDDAGVAGAGVDFGADSGCVVGRTAAFGAGAGADVDAGFGVGVGVGF
jgi:hypothetical protein